MTKSSLFICSLACLLGQGCSSVADEAIKQVYAYGFVDLEGAKTSAIIVEYDQEVKASSVNASTYEILDYVMWQEQQQGYERTIDSHVKNLRAKIGDNPKDPKWLFTVHGVGYRFEDPTKNAQ